MPQTAPQVDSTVSTGQVAALVRAIRQAYGAPCGLSGVEAFHVHNIHDFARRLADQGVIAKEDSES